VRGTLLSLAVLLFVIAGCVRRPMQELEVGSDRTTDDPPPDPGAVREVIVAGEDANEEESQPGSARGGPPGQHPAPDPVLFRLGAGYGALGQVDLAPCREQGLQAGYLHMRVTFRPNGRVIRAAVESPLPPPPEALACIGEQLELAMVPMFEGGDVTLAKSFFIN
jgi:hypothetical protein